jgi:hypothetical protein
MGNKISEIKPKKETTNDEPASKGTSRQDLQTYLEDMAQHPERRPGGIEGRMFERLDRKTAEHEKIKNRMAQLNAELNQLRSQDLKMSGVIDNLIEVLVEAESERRKAPETDKE